MVLRGPFQPLQFCDSAAIQRQSVLPMPPSTHPGPASRRASQQSLHAFSYAASMSPRNNLMLEKSPNKWKKKTFPAAFASISEYKASAGGCLAASWQQQGAAHLHTLLLSAQAVACRVQSQNQFTHKTSDTREECIKNNTKLLFHCHMLQLKRQGKQSSKSAWALPLCTGREGRFSVLIFPALYLGTFYTTLKIPFCLPFFFFKSLQQVEAELC